MCCSERSTIHIDSLPFLHERQVLERCVHFMGHADARVRLLVMDIVKTAVLSLKHENTLLPLVHLLWQPLVGRL